MKAESAEKKALRLAREQKQREKLLREQNRKPWKNYALYLGYLIVILTVISFFYTAFKTNFVVQAMLRGMKAGVSAVIMSVVYDMGSGIVRSKDILRIIVMILAFTANYYFHINVILIILASALIGVIRTLFFEKKKEA